MMYIPKSLISVSKCTMYYIFYYILLDCFLERLQNKLQGIDILILNISDLSTENGNFNIFFTMPPS